MSQKDKENRRANSALSLFFNRKRFFFKERSAIILANSCLRYSKLFPSETGPRSSSKRLTKSSYFPV